MTLVGLTLINYVPPFCQPTFSASSANFPSAQAEIGRGWENKNLSQPNPGLRAAGTPCRKGKLICVDLRCSDVAVALVIVAFGRDFVDALELHFNGAADGPLEVCEPDLKLLEVHGDTAPCSKPPVDIYLKLRFCNCKTQLSHQWQKEVWNKVLGHFVYKHVKKDRL